MGLHCFRARQLMSFNRDECLRYSTTDLSGPKLKPKPLINRRIALWLEMLLALLTPIGAGRPCKVDNHAVTCFELLDQKCREFFADFHDRDVVLAGLVWVRTMLG